MADARSHLLKGLDELDDADLRMAAHFGLSPEQFVAARNLGMAPERYAANVRARPAPPTAPDLTDAERRTADHLGLTAEEIAAADTLGMSPERYAAYRDARSVDDAAKAEHEAAKLGKAREEAEHRQLVDRLMEAD